MFSFKTVPYFQFLRRSFRLPEAVVSRHCYKRLWTGFGVLWRRHQSGSRISVPRKRYRSFFP